MSKRSKDALRSADTFELINSGVAADSSVHSIDATLFGATEVADANRLQAYGENIFEIKPDPSQPRRVIPQTVRDAAKWDGDLSQIENIFLCWENLVNDARRKRGQVDTFNLKHYLRQEIVGNVDVENETVVDDTTSTSGNLPDEISSLEQSLVDLVELAVSINRDGLTNPITVIRVSGQGYVIETGERRWLAYHLLFWHTAGDKRYAKIAARTVDKLNIWRQAAENNARSNLNAISKARQFAVLLMELLREEKNHTFTPFSEFQADNKQGYYAQVGDGNDKELRIPKGKSERILNATGLKSGKQLREYRALLRLPKTVWDIADDLNWPERAIRDLQNRSMNEDDLISLAIEKAEADGYSVPMGTLSTREKTKKSKKAKSETLAFAPSDKRYYNQFLRLLQKAKQGKPDAIEEAFQKIDEIRRWLDEQEIELSD